MPTTCSPTRKGIAFAIAVAADALQIGLFPLFAEGFLSPLDDVLDFVVACLLCAVLGFHWAFLPTVIAKLVPGLDLFPTWTTAVWFVSRSRTKPATTSGPQGSLADAAGARRALE